MDARMGSLIVCLLLTRLAITMVANAQGSHGRKAGIGLALLTLIQTGSGVAAILMRLPIVIEILHAVMADLLLLMVVYAWILLNRYA